MKKIVPAFLIVVLVSLVNCSLVFSQEASSALPDLSIQSVTFERQPKEGEQISAAKILIVNLGKNIAEENKLKLECLATDCLNDADCDKISKALTGSMVMPALKHGTSLELTWTPAPVNWVTGNFIISAIIDPENKIKEASELNNSKHSIIYLKQLSPERE